MACSGPFRQDRLQLYMHSHSWDIAGEGYSIVKTDSDETKEHFKPSGF